MTGDRKTSVIYVLVTFLSTKTEIIGIILNMYWGNIAFQFWAFDFGQNSFDGIAS